MGMAAGSWSYPRAVLAAPRQAPASPARTHHRLVARPARGLHPAPHTLHPAPCTPHPVPYTLHPATTTWPQGPSAPPAAQGAAGTRGGGPVAPAALLQPAQALATSSQPSTTTGAPNTTLNTAQIGLPPLAGHSRPDHAATVSL